MLYQAQLLYSKIIEDYTKTVLISEDLQMISKQSTVIKSHDLSSSILKEEGQRTRRGKGVARGFR